MKKLGMVVVGWLLAMGLLFILVVIVAPRGLFGRLLDLSPRRRP